MSFAEIQAEVSHLTVEELKALRDSIEAEMGKKSVQIGGNMAQFLGCTRGMMTFHPGWDEPESPSLWKALRDDSSL